MLLQRTPSQPQAGDGYIKADHARTMRALAPSLLNEASAPLVPVVVVVLGGGDGEGGSVTTGVKTKMSVM